ncbi:MAG: hypothetical protein J3Q66DRAFT_399883 [Benniella sp.]|nr:MAG: hypothetical protein J3Q66DRAFT_399883 [Benniella sp.]
MSLHDYHQEVAQNAVADDVAILCDDPDAKTRISATLVQLTLTSVQTKREPLLFVVQEDVRAVQHQARLGHAGIQSTVVEASIALAMTQDMWAAVTLQTQVIVTSGQALLLMLQNGIFKMKEVALVVLDICHDMMQGDALHQLIEGHLKAEMLRPRLTAFVRSTEPSLEYLLTATLIRTMTATIDGTFLVASATQVCRLIRCDGFMGAEDPMDTACNHLVALCRDNDLFATAVKSYEYAKAHLGSWCSTHIWTIAFQACREEVLALHHPQSANFLRLLEHAEQVSRDLELAFPLPTWKGVSEKLWRLVALLRSPQNGTIHPALVLVSSVPSALVIAKFLKRVRSLGQQVGMQGARVTSLISTSGPVALQTIDGFENGQSNVLVVASIISQGLPLSLCHQIIQFDVAKLRDSADLAHYYMMVRISHPLAGFLGGLFLKAMVCTDVFVTNLSGKPGDLHKDSSKIYTSIRHSQRERTTFGMAYIADGPIGAFRSLVKTYSQVPTAQSWVDFAAEYRRSILRQRPRLTASNTVATVQSTLGYTFSNVQVLLDALNRGTPQCERLEFVGDAALDLVAAVYWSEEYPATPKETLSSVKSASVCNNFLAMVFMELGFHTLIQCSSDFSNNLAKTLLSHNAMLSVKRTGDFWMEVDYQKGIADVMEAVLGAVYIDSEFDIGAVAAVFNKCLLPFIQSAGPRAHNGES